MKPIWTKEASEENERIQNSLINMVDIGGSYAGMIDRDGTQTMYSITVEKGIGGTSRQLKPDDPIIKEIIDTPPDDFTAKFIYETFCGFNGKKAKYSLYDKCTIKRFGKSIDTTLGRLIANKVPFGHMWDNKDWEYFNYEINGKTFRGLFNKITQLCIEKKCDPRTYVRISDISTDFILRFSTVFNVSVDYETVMPDEDYYQFRDGKFDAVSEEILANSDTEKFEKTRAEIIEYAKKKYKDSPQTEMFESGSKAKWNDDYAEMYVSFGALPSLVDGKPVFILNSLAKGIGVENIPTNANIAIYGAYSAAKSTALGGTIYKRLSNGLSSLFGEKGDCGSTDFVEFVSSEWEDYCNKYIKGPNGLIKITLDNVNKYVGKKVMMRDPIYCRHKDDGFCSTCLGDGMFEIANQGDTIPLGCYTQAVGSRVLNLFMKARHTLQYEEFKINDLNDFLM